MERTSQRSRLHSAGQAIVLGTFAFLALGLAMLGVFAVVSSLVATRTREMGVRLTLGATPQSLVRLMLQHAVVPVVAGTVLGLVATRWLSVLARAQLYSVDTRDPLMLTGAIMLVAAAALAAAYLAASHASRVDPVVVLRTP